jgi:gamma-glutamylputrescine oxidase
MDAPRLNPPIQSLWSHTAFPSQAFPALRGDIQADVAIIGAGYTGLSAAHHIAASGLRPVVVDANSVGWGASGRNGGVVSAKFRLPFAQMASAQGTDVARRMYDIAHESIDVLEELVETLKLDRAQYARVGQIKGAHNAASLAASLADMAWMRSAMGDASVSALSKAEVLAEF